MSQRIIHGFSEAQLQALKISSQERDECLKYLIPYKRCMLQGGLISNFFFGQCQDEKKAYTRCQRPLYYRKTGLLAMMMKKNDPKRFEEQKVAPSLQTNFRPTIFTAQRH